MAAHLPLRTGAHCTAGGTGGTGPTIMQFHLVSEVISRGRASRPAVAPGMYQEVRGVAAQEEHNQNFENRDLTVL